MRLIQQSDTSSTAGSRAVLALEDLPEVLTVEESAAVLRISRTAAYELARRWRVSGGAEGLPVISLGRSLRVSRADLIRLLRMEPLPSEPAGARSPRRGR